VLLQGVGSQRRPAPRGRLLPLASCGPGPRRPSPVEWPAAPGPLTCHPRRSRFCARLASFFHFFCEGPRQAAKGGRRPPLDGLTGLGQHYTGVLQAGRGRAQGGEVRLALKVSVRLTLVGAGSSPRLAHSSRHRGETPTRSPRAFVRTCVAVCAGVAPAGKASAWIDGTRSDSLPPAFAVHGPCCGKNHPIQYQQVLPLCRHVQPSGKYSCRFWAGFMYSSSIDVADLVCPILGERWGARGGGQATGPPRPGVAITVTLPPLFHPPESQATGRVCENAGVFQAGISHTSGR
jgi:hypothetical protein